MIHFNFEYGQHADENEEKNGGVTIIDTTVVVFSESGDTLDILTGATVDPNGRMVKAKYYRVRMGALEREETLMAANVEVVVGDFSTRLEVDVESAVSYLLAAWFRSTRPLPNFQPPARTMGDNVEMARELVEKLQGIAKYLPVATIASMAFVMALDDEKFIAVDKWAALVGDLQEIEKCKLSNFIDCGDCGDRIENPKTGHCVYWDRFQNIKHAGPSDVAWPEGVKY